MPYQITPDVLTAGLNAAANMTHDPHRVELLVRAIIDAWSNVPGAHNGDLWVACKVVMKVLVSECAAELSGMEQPAP